MSALTCRPLRLFIALPLLLFALPGSLRALDPCDPPSSATTAPIPTEEHPGARRESEMRRAAQGANAPTISFIDSPTAVCYQPDPAQDVCFVNWYYLSVDGSPNYMICMEITLNEIGKVARYQGFFQTSMYAPYNLQDRGFKVACGAPGASGDPNRGFHYGYTIRARDSANLSSANYGTVVCPAYVP